MFKKSLAIMLVGTMLFSSASAVMAAESEATSSVTSAVESVAETESQTTESTDDVDFRALVEKMSTEIEKAAAEVDLGKKEEVLGKEFSEDGTVFSIIENILNDIQEKRTAEGKDLGDVVTEALEAFANLDETDEATLDALFEEGIFGAGPEESEAEEESGEDAGVVAGLIAGFVFEAAKDNEQIAEAVEATDSKLFEILSTEDEDVSIIDLISEEPFEEFEAELTKVTDYINEQEGPKQSALDLLNLVHEIVDEIHVAVHGHGHEALETK